MYIERCAFWLRARPPAMELELDMIETISITHEAFERSGLEEPQMTELDTPLGLLPQDKWVYVMLKNAGITVELVRGPDTAGEPVYEMSQILTKDACDYQLSNSVEKDIQLVTSDQFLGMQVKLGAGCMWKVTIANEIPSKPVSAQRSREPRGRGAKTAGKVFELNSQHAYEILFCPSGNDLRCTTARAAVISINVMFDADRAMANSYVVTQRRADVVFVNKHIITAQVCIAFAHVFCSVLFCSVAVPPSERTPPFASQTVFCDKDGDLNDDYHATRRYIKGIEHVALNPECTKLNVDLQDIAGICGLFPLNVTTFIVQNPQFERLYKDDPGTTFTKGAHLTCLPRCPHSRSWHVARLRVPRCVFCVLSGSTCSKLSPVACIWNGSVYGMPPRRKRPVLQFERRYAVFRRIYVRHLGRSLS